MLALVLMAPLALSVHAQTTYTDTSNSYTPSASTSDSTSTGITTNPGLPNTGGAEDTSTAIALLVSSAVVCVGGGLVLMRRFAR